MFIKTFVKKLVESIYYTLNKTKFKIIDEEQSKFTNDVFYEPVRESTTAEEEVNARFSANNSTFEIDETYAKILDRTNCSEDIELDFEEQQLQAIKVVNVEDSRYYYQFVYSEESKELDNIIAKIKDDTYIDYLDRLSHNDNSISKNAASLIIPKLTLDSVISYDDEDIEYIKGELCELFASWSKENEEV